ncbi:MAG: response regulator [Candidatus Hydrogenedentes bacterium]|nr:response regulator [Candidatus Hydrogenedentota bacterium]
MQQDSMRGATPREVLERAQEAERLEAIAMTGRGIAHDINNLMETVLGNVALLRDDLKGDQSRASTLEAIEKAAELAGSLTQRILAVTQGRTRKPEPVNLNAIVYHLLLVEETKLAPSVRIIRHIDPDLWRVLAEHTAISQAALNLATNAVEALNGKGRVTIRTRNLVLDSDSIPEGSSLRAGPYVLLSIEDDGGGMNPQTLASIFEPGFTTREDKTGQGLATVRKIVESANGQVVFNSFPGRGTVCRVYLPALDAGDDAAPISSAVMPAGGETILIVDDERMILEVTQETLRRLGYSTLTARNGQEAVEIAGSHDGMIHLALLDMSMPVMGGADAFPRLRALRPEMRIIICTGFEQELVSSQLFETGGAKSFLLKPFRLSALANEIRKVLDTPDAA